MAEGMPEELEQLARTARPSRRGPTSSAVPFTGMDSVIQLQYLRLAASFDMPPPVRPVPGRAELDPIKNSSELEKADQDEGEAWGLLIDKFVDEGTAEALSGDSVFGELPDPPTPPMLEARRRDYRGSHRIRVGQLAAM